MDLELFTNILEQGRLLGLQEAKLTGGEPFLHPQISCILDIIQAANFNVNVETNGVLLTPELAQAVAACRIATISVSLDGAEAETHEWVREVPGCYQASLKVISYLVQAGLKPQIILTIMRRNQDQLESVARLAQELGSGSVKFNIVQPSPRSNQMREDDELLNLSELLELGRWVEQELISSVDIPVFFHQPPAFRPLRQLIGPNGVGSGMCGILTIIGVLLDGSYALCGIGEHLPELVFGHASRDNLADVCQTHPVLLEIREGLPQRLSGICHDCLMKGRCLGSCLAQNYYQGWDLWTPYWFCHQAEAAELFPANRKRPQ